jgi:hypothetical protein
MAPRTARASSKSSKTATSATPSPKAKATAKAAPKTKGEAETWTSAKSAPQSSTKPTAPAGKAPAPAVVTETKAVVTGSELKKKEVLDEVVERSGIKKKFAKPVIEAMIDVLGEALSEGREINLQPFGRIKQQRTKDTSNAQIIVAKIRQSKAAGPALDPADRVDSGEQKDAGKLAGKTSEGGTETHAEKSVPQKVAQAGE